LQFPAAIPSAIAAQKQNAKGQNKKTQTPKSALQGLSGAYA
jgi:hypothetical protein